MTITRYLGDLYYYTVGSDDVFTFNVTDNITATEKTYSTDIFVSAVNNAPVITVINPVYNFTDVVSKTNDSVNSVLDPVSVFDADAGDQLMWVTMYTEIGYINITGLDLLQNVQAVAQEGTNITFQATQATINTILSQKPLSYTLPPQPEDTIITDTLTIVVNDMGHTGAGGWKQDTATIEIITKVITPAVAQSTKTPNALISIGSVGAVGAVAAGYWYLKKKKIIDPEKDDFGDLEEEHIANPLYQEKEYYGNIKNPMFDPNSI
jgi:hypothetical protein